MNNLTPFKGFLSSLSRITPYRFEVSEGSGLREDQAIHVVPIQSDETTIGTLTAYGPNGRKNTEDIQTFLNRTAGLIQERFNHQKEIEALAQELTQSFEDLSLYARIARQIKALKFSADRLKNVLQDLLGTLRVDLAFTRVFKHPEYNIHIGQPDLIKRIEHPVRYIDSLIDTIPPSIVPSTAPYFIVNDSAAEPDFRKLHQHRYRFLAVPMRNNGETFGWLGMLSFNMKEIFRQSELSLLSSMAEQITVVIVYSQLYKEMERFVINVVKSLVHAIEAKDYYTRGHSERVNHYCMALADNLSMDREQRASLHWASILHDVGKIGIPEIILNKPEGLDDEEYGLVKSHSQKGYDILKPIEQIDGALPGILHHHERYDGKGYPKGLKGNEIPLIARIIAIADTFDALTSDRAYRSGIHPESAFEIMKKESGRQLDPNLLDLFVNLYQTADQPME